MRSLTLTLTAGALLTLTPLAHATQVAAITSATQRHGTKLDWYADGEQAYALAKQTGRPVIEMHISGEFHDPGLT